MDKGETPREIKREKGIQTNVSFLIYAETKFGKDSLKI